MNVRELSVPIVWALLVAGLHALPVGNLGGSDWLRAVHADKLAHFLMFSVLGTAVLVAACKAEAWEGKRWLFLVLVAAYGVLLEGSQALWFATRSAELADAIADVAGASVAWPLFRGIYQRWP